MSNIKLAVSFYSLQDQYVTGKMKLEDIMNFAKNELGAEMEFIGDQMMKGSPHPSNETLEEWDRLIAKYQIKPIINNAYVNTCLYKNRNYTTKEGTLELIEEIKLADRLGFRMIKLVSVTPIEMIEAALPYAEKHDVIITIEIHGGMSFNILEVKKFMELIKRTNSPYLGFTVDMGIFCRRHPRVSTQYFRSLGLDNEELIQYIDDIFAAGTDPVRLMEEHPEKKAEYFGKAKTELEHLYSIYATGYENSQLSLLDEYMPYIKHIHGKLYEITEEGVEYSIPYQEILQYLDSKNYDGYIATEYEGTRFTLYGEETKEIEQVKKHHEMLKKYISELSK